MSEIIVIPQKTLNVNLKNVASYDGVAYGISVVTKSGDQANILVVGPSSEAVADAIHAAWPSQPVRMDKMSRVAVVGHKDIDDEEL